MSQERQRTYLQNRSLHKWATLMADSFNDAGYDQRMVIEQFKEGMEIPWTMEAVKHIFRLVAHAMYDVESTADLTTTQIQAVYEVVDARFAELTGIRHEWPRDEPPIEDCA